MGVVIAGGKISGYKLAVFEDLTGIHSVKTQVMLRCLQGLRCDIIILPMTEGRTAEAFITPEEKVCHSS